MISKAGNNAVGILWMTMYCASAQGPAPVTIEIDAINIVQYENDVADYSKLGTDPGQIPGVPAKNFSTYIGVGDIIAVNGKPAKGTALAWNQTLNLTPNGTPGTMIADATRGAIRIFSFEIQQADGTPVGTILAEGFGGGPGPVGGPPGMNSGNHAITGGTGAFLGVRGQFAADSTRAVAIPVASVTEDPSNRRARKGGASHWVLQFIPMSYPQVGITPSGAAITHADFSLVSTSKPAAAGEILSLFATGLGPTRPAADLGKPFPASPPALVNSPIDVLVNGRPAEVLGAVGLPGTFDGYQVNFRLPPDASKGSATIEVSAAWIAGSKVSIAVQ